MDKVVSLVGTRPQFIKEAVINHEVRRQNAWHHILVHSGQHYDFNMSETFFSELEISCPDYFLAIGSGGHAAQTASAMCKFEEILIKETPDMVLLYGDTNTTLAGAITAAKLHIPIAHVEAGPRTYNKLFPEEVNRVLTDHISDFLFACTELNVNNLQKEGITKGVHNTGDVMYDLYCKMSASFDSAKELQKYGLDGNAFVLATIHRDFNTDNKKTLSAILSGLNTVADNFSLKVFLPLHPRTRKRICEFGLGSYLDGFITKEPIGYLELMSLAQAARFIVTDSGGFQKESYWAKKRGLLIMPQGWQEITDTGWHTLVSDPENANWTELAEAIMRPFEYPENIFGAGDAARKIVDIMRNN